MPDTWFDQPEGPGTPVFERQPEVGAPFTSRKLKYDMQEFEPQTRRIRAGNKIRGTKWDYASDLLRPEAKKLKKFESFGGSLDGRPWRRYPYGPQIDHIIPRVDKFGCPCGSNSVKNAQVISALLNSKLSNNCADPIRVAMIKHYTVPPANAVVLPVDLQALIHMIAPFEPRGFRPLAISLPDLALDW
jgi:hypothetical protein